MRWQVIQVVVLLVVITSIQTKEVKAISIPSPISLSYETTPVNCTTTFDTTTDQILSVSSVLYDEDSVNWNSLDDNNNHYTDLECGLRNTSGTTSLVECVFNLQYYSNVGNNWICRIDYQFVNTTSVTETTQTEISELIGLNSQDIDFSELTLDSISTPYKMTIENRGNVDLNANISSLISYAMNCDSGTIPLDNMRYSLNSGTNYDLMTPISIDSETIAGLSIPRRTDDAGISTADLYWRIKIEKTGLGGNCAGSLSLTPQR